MQDDRSAADICHAQLRATMVWCLSAALSIWYRGPRPMLSQQQAEYSAWLGRAHLRCYAKLAVEALNSNRLLYKLRPKHHYFEHLLDETFRLHRNPIHQANFVDEDLMKMLKNVSISCHPRTAKLTWGRRYVLKKAMTWLKLSRRNS